jgi:hypothetical protein
MKEKKSTVKEKSIRKKRKSPKPKRLKNSMQRCCNIDFLFLSKYEIKNL